MHLTPRHPSNSVLLPNTEGLRRAVPHLGQPFPLPLFSSGDPLTSQSEDEDGRWEEIEMVCHGWYYICADVKALDELSTGPVPSTDHRGGYTSPFHRETS